MGGHSDLGMREVIPGEGKIDLNPKGQMFSTPVLSNMAAISHMANSASPKFKCTVSVIRF